MIHIVVPRISSGLKPLAYYMKALRANAIEPRKGLHGIRQGFSPTEEAKHGYILKGIKQGFSPTEGG